MGKPAELGGKIKVQSEFGMWGPEFERLQDILKTTSDLFVNVRYDPDLLVPLWDCLNEFYRILRPLLLKPDRAKKDKEIRALKQSIYGELRRRDGLRRFPGAKYVLKESILEELDAMYNALMDHRQVLNMGVATRKKTTSKSRLGSAITGHG